MNTLEMKQKYSGSWLHSNARELCALSWLKLMGIEAEPTGHGTLSSELLPDYHKDAFDKFDLFSEDLAMFFEVTGTDYTKTMSAHRFSSPTLAVLKVKVDDAEYFGLEKHVMFVSVNDQQGEIRFLPCVEVKQYPLISYAAGESEYYGVPWEKWWQPFRALVFLLKRKMKVRVDP